MENISISEIRKELIKKLINEKYKDRYSPEKIKEIIIDILSKIDNGKIITQLREQSEMTDSKEVMQTNNEIFIDIYTLYETINNYYSVISNIQNNSLSMLQQIDNIVTKADSIINNYEATMKGYSNPIYKIENFIDCSDAESDLSLYKERYNEQIQQETTNVFNKNNSTLILPKLRSSNMAYLKDGVMAATAKINKQYCGIYLEENNYPIKNILIPDNSIWKEEIQTNAPIKIFSENKNYTINNGAVCEIVIDFEAVTVINELFIKPYKFYPIDILEIKYKTTDINNEQYKDLVYKDNIDENLRPRTLNKGISYNFKNILVKKISILINQTNYERHVLTINSENENKKFMKNMSDNTLSKNKIFKPIFQDSYEDNPEIEIIDKAVQNNVSIQKTLSDISTACKQIKYRYEYGLTNILPLNNEYDRTGMYVSKEISVNFDIKYIKIITDEQHPVANDIDVTDIEYYITFANNPTWKDWFPILPANKKKTNCEILQQYDDFCYLRFPTTKIGGIYTDGSALEESEDYFIKRNKNGQIYAVEIPTFDSTSIYTIKYEPIEESHMVFTPSNHIVTSTEEINGENKTCFKLQNNIAINQDTSNIFIKIVDIANGKVVSSTYDNMINYTNKINTYNSYENFNSENNTEYEFYVEKNFLYFNRVILKDYKIVITYQHNINKFRLKAILRRNSKINKYITPVLNSIKYEITVN